MAAFSIFRRLSTVVLAGYLLVVVGWLWMLVLSIQHHERQLALAWQEAGRYQTTLLSQHLDRSFKSRDLDAVQQAINRLAVVGGRVEVAIIAPDGGILARTPGQQSPISLARRELARRSLETERLEWAQGSQPFRTHYALRLADDTGQPAAALVTTLDWEPAYRQGQAAAGWLLIQHGLLAVTVLLLLIVGGQRLLLRPLRAMVRHAQAISSGAAPPALPRPFVAELADLAQAARQMHESLSAREADLRALNDSLEATVAQRTAALQSLNGQLHRELAKRAAIASALRTSEARFRNAFDHAGVGKALVGLGGEWLQVNRALCAFLGYSAAELLATKTFQTITHPDDLDLDLAQAGRLLSGEISAYQLEKRYLHKGGHFVWAMLSGTLLRDSAAAPQYFLAEIQDITARKQAEAALREREMLLRSVSDTLPDGLIYQFVRLPGRPPHFRYISAGVERLWGISPEQAYADAEQLLSRMLPADRARFEAASATANQCLSVFEFEGQMRLPDGRLRWSYLRSTPHRLDDGGVVWSGVELDTTRRKEAEIALAASEARFRELVNDLHVGVMLQGPQAEILHCNPAARELLGLSEEQLSGRRPLEGELPMIYESGAPFSAPDLPVPRVLATGEPVHDLVIGVYRPASADRAWLLVNAEPQRSHEGRVEQVICTFSDITDRRAAETALRVSEARNRSVLNALPARIAVLDSEGMIIAVNDAWSAFARSSGDPEERHTGVGINYAAVCRRAAPSDPDAARVLVGLQSVLTSARALFVYEYGCPSPDADRWYMLMITPLGDGHGGAVVTHLDVTERKILELEREQLIARLHDQAHTDWLTGVANRRAFMDAGEREWQRARRFRQPLALLLIDVDHFKRVNDTHGHGAGDMVLREVARHCRQELRTTDLLGRYGGEEFAVLLPSTGLPMALEVAERLRERIAALAVEVGPALLQVTVSIGAALVQPPELPLETGLQQADAALYAAKGAGRNCVMAYAADELQPCADPSGLSQP